jgi:hypothetical protein
MPSDAAVFFKQGNVVMAMQEMRASETRDSCSDDSDFFLQTRLLGRNFSTQGRTVHRGNAKLDKQKFRHD